MESEADFSEIELPNSEFIEIIKSKTCIGKGIWVYRLSRVLDEEFLKTFSKNAVLTYPLGEKYRYFNINVPGNYLLSGILGDNELKFIPRFGSVVYARAEVEQKLEEFCKQAF